MSIDIMALKSRPGVN